jgi:GTPase SAR1 family protein
MYDITNKSTLQDIEYYFDAVLRFKDLEIGFVPMVLVGNKIDLNDEREVETSAGKELAEKMRLHSLKFL